MLMNMKPARAPDLQDGADLPIMRFESPSDAIMANAGAAFVYYAGLLVSF